MKLKTMFPALLGTLALSAPAAISEKPNVIFILADDLGWADATLYGHTKYYRTPNLERLAHSRRPARDRPPLLTKSGAAHRTRLDRDRLQDRRSHAEKLLIA